MINKLHHIAIICSDYKKSLDFYTNILGLEIIEEHYREDRNSYMTFLGLNGEYLIELFDFKDAPERLTYPEARGLRHLAFEVDNIEKSVDDLKQKGIEVEDIRTSEYTEEKFTFFYDPDGLPIEIIEPKNS